MFWKIVTWIPQFVWGLLMLCAGVGPSQAVSNLAEWLSIIGIDHIPPWLASASADRWVFWIAFIGFLVWPVIVVRAGWPRQTLAPQHEGNRLRPMVEMPRNPIQALIPKDSSIPSEKKDEKKDEKEAQPPAGLQSESILRKPPVQAPQQVPQSEGRIIVNVTPKELMDLFQGHTEMQGQQLVAAYIDKWIKVSGPVNNVSLHQLPFSEVRLFVSVKSYPDLLMGFNKEWSNQLNVLRPGDPITVRGQISEVHHHNCLLENCELQDM